MPGATMPNEWGGWRKFAAVVAAVAVVAVVAATDATDGTAAAAVAAAAAAAVDIDEEGAVVDEKGASPCLEFDMSDVTLPKPVDPFPFSFYLLFSY